ncbi:MAG: GreA/GreB family elongation factor [Candidatus Bathyarchaeota archaeon]|nr:GreA/GreB family elongation factor [Candidatus Bathyarchaeota archaeon]
MKREKYYLTPTGLKKYKEEYDRLKKKKREERDKMKESRDELWRPEDLNPDYEALRGDLSFIERRLKDLEHIFKNVRLIRRPNRASKKVILGSKITIEIEGVRENLNLVGTLEANPSEGKISVDSPVGKSLLNHKEGDEVIIEFPIKRVYKILKVEFP